MSTTALLRPKSFLLGIFISFFTCSLAGYLVSQSARLHHFTRFFLTISPQAYYFPTASELLATARHKVSKDKILVLLGGSSILRGAGQGSNELWTEELQKHLGDRYKVLNFASDGASFSSFGGVAFRMLRKEYPKMLFLAASYQLNSEGSLDGLDPYCYLFWDAYYKNLFEPYPNELKTIRALRKEEMATVKGLEMHLLSYLDSWLYFRNLWNWFNYQLLFTVWSDYAVEEKPFQPRRKSHDPIGDPAYREKLWEVNHDAEHIKNYSAVICQPATMIEDLNHHPYKVSKIFIDGGRKGYETVFEPQDRAQILMVQSTYNPALIARVDQNHQDAYWAVDDQSNEMIASLGYEVLDVGRDFVDRDYVDVSHFSPSGGKKLALKVAKKVKAISAAKGY